MKYITFCVVLLLGNMLQAQVAITIPGLPGGLIKPDMLWNIVVVNQSGDFDAVVQLTVNDRNNKNVLTARSSMLHFAKGAKTIFYNNAIPVNYTYNALGGSNEWLKAGKYFVCYTINRLNHGEGPIAQECTELNVEPLSPPMLNEPQDKSVIYEVRPNFTWLQPAPPQVFRELKYEMRLAEILAGQTALQALQNNAPVYFENGLTQLSKLLPSSYKALEINHDYAWQVTAYDNNYSIKSEYWQFRVTKDSVKEIVDGSPFLNLGLNQGNIGVMHQGYIKIALNNYSKDTTAILNICEEGHGMNKCMTSITVSIKQGTNYIVKQIDSKLKLDQNKIYQIIWINSQAEQWILRFQPKYYNNIKLQK